MEAVMGGLGKGQFLLAYSCPYSHEMSVMDDFDTAYIRRMIRRAILAPLAEAEMHGSSRASPFPVHDLCRRLTGHRGREE